jgi:hypothetical protein
MFERFNIQILIVKQTYYKKTNQLYLTIIMIYFKKMLNYTFGLLRESLFHVR